MKKILIVTHYFYPTNTPRAFRATELADELSQRGYLVSVLIGESDSFIENYSSETVKNKLDTETLKKIQKRTMRSQILSLASFYLGDLWVIKKRDKFFSNIDLNNYDIIVSIALPVYTHVLTIKETKKQRWHGRLVADWGDPFYLPDGDNKKPFYFEQLQKRWLNAFDYNTVPTQSAADFYQKYVSKNKIKVIPQGFKLDPIDYKSLKFLKKQDRKPKFVYTGAFYKNIRNPIELFETLLKIDQDFEFYIYTNLNDVDFAPILEVYQKKFQGKLVVHDLIPRDELLKTLEKFNFAINLENTVTAQVPSKLIDLTIAGLPILSIKPDKVEVDKIMDFLNGEYSQKLNVDLKKYDIKNVVDQFEALF